MGCNKRLLLLGICISQLIATIWRQIFDFLGFMWGPIIVNFFQIIFVIFGFFGGWQYKYSYICAYASWALIYLQWNCFVFCFYLNIGTLSRDADLLSLGAKSVSWWESNGPGCKALFLPNKTGIEAEPWLAPRPDLVTGCAIDYYILEAVQAALHILLALVGFCISVPLLRRIKNGDDRNKSSTLKKKKKTIQAPLYPVDLMPRRVTNGPDFSGETLDETDPRGSRPMTPRRVKRRSETGRNGAAPHHHSGVSGAGGGGAGTMSRRHHHQHHGGGVPAAPGHRSSLRNSKRHRSSHHSRHDETSRGHTNFMFRHSPENSFEEERPPSARSSYSNFHGSRAHSYRHFLVSGPPGYSSQSETPM